MDTLPPPASSLDEAEDAIQAAMLAGDVAALDLLIAEELDFVGPDGTRVSKQADLDLYRTGATRFHFIRERDRRTRFTGSEGSSTVTADVMVSVTHAPPIQATVRWERRWRLVDERWQVFGGSVVVVDDKAG